MARQKLSSEESKKTNVSVRLSEAEVEAVKVLAETAGCDVSKFIRLQLLPVFGEYLLKHVDLKSLRKVSANG